MPDGCGGVLQCPGCKSGWTCVVNTCVPPPCKPITDCTNLCNGNPDGCGGVLWCPPCKADEYCTPFGCYKKSNCIPKDCNQLGASCGQVDDGCGNQLSCGSCPAGQTCGTAHKCCVAKTCVQVGYGCGTFDDACAGTVDCGACQDGKSCLVTKDGTKQCRNLCNACAQGESCDQSLQYCVPESEAAENTADVDGDGVTGDADRCPDAKGSLDNAGCPAHIEQGAVGSGSDIEPAEGGNADVHGVAESPFIGRACSLLPHGTSGSMGFLLMIGAAITLLWRRSSREKP